MIFNLVNKDYPIWDIDNVDLSFLNEDELTNPIFYEDYYKERKVYKKGTSPLLDKVIELGPTKEQYLDIIYDDQYQHLTRHHWPVKRENLESFVNVSTNIFCDPPQFHMSNHFDNRIQVILSIINLKDNECGTIFHKEGMKPGIIKDDYGIIYESSKNNGEGVVFLNTEDTPHSITHNGHNLRYCLFSSLTLTI